MHQFAYLSLPTKEFTAAAAMDFLRLFLHLPVASFACVIFATSILLLVQCAGTCILPDHPIHRHLGVKKKRNQTSALGDPSRNTTKQQAGPSRSGNDSDPGKQYPCACFTH